MQGELSEIDIRSILQLVELGQRTGQLLVEAYTGHVGSSGRTVVAESGKAGLGVGHSWYVFFSNGEIVYAGDPEIGLARLRGHLRRYQKELAIDSLSDSSYSVINAPEYGCLWALLENRTLMPAQARTILQSMVQETLFDLLSLHHGCFIFEMGPPLTPQLMTLPIAPLTARIAKQVQEWKQFYPHLQSPDQCPVMTDAAAMSQVLPKGTVSTLLRYGDGKTSVRQLSHYLNREILTVAQAIYPCVQRGWVHFTQPSPPKSAVGFSPIASPTNADAQPFTPPVIACLDDAPTIRETVEVMLTQHGYEVAGLADPIEALSQMFKIAPNLILCDITMPNLDGYEVCAMLRQSTVFRQTPIIMLTGKDGFIDRVKARMVGATDYLAKPFGEEELVMLVEKYVGGGSAQMISPSHRGRGLQTVSANLAD